MKAGDSIHWYDELRPGDIVVLLQLHPGSHSALVRGENVIGFGNFGSAAAWAGWPW